MFFAGGTGHPYFSTDTGVVLRAVEVEADVILLAKSIDGVYDSDPKMNPDAKKYDEVSIDQVIAGNLQVVDMTASILARDNKVPMWVFGLNEENSIVNTVKGNFSGTKVTVQDGFRKGMVSEMDERLKVYDDKMKKTYEHLENDYLGIRAGRANPHVLDKLRVDYYGTPTPIQQVGNVTIPEARMIQIAPWEKTLIKRDRKSVV